uniref:ORF 2 n=1 Tax=Piper methysticum tymovirus 1 TaxID=2794437 RepID=A0A7T5QZD8_9VIRU|nr:ORF 2 [Piper methysticum tymovirus 1]
MHPFNIFLAASCAIACLLLILAETLRLILLRHHRALDEERAPLITEPLNQLRTLAAQLAAPTPMTAETLRNTIATALADHAQPRRDAAPHDCHADIQRHINAALAPLVDTLAAQADALTTLANLMHGALNQPPPAVRDASPPPPPPTTDEPLPPRAPSPGPQGSEQTRSSTPSTTDQPRSPTPMSVEFTQSAALPPPATTCDHVSCDRRDPQAENACPDFYTPATALPAAPSLASPDEQVERWITAEEARRLADERNTLHDAPPVHFPRITHRLSEAVSLHLTPGQTLAAWTRANLRIDASARHRTYSFTTTDAQGTTFVFQQRQSIGLEAAITLYSGLLERFIERVNARLQQDNGTILSEHRY